MQETAGKNGFFPSPKAVGKNGWQILALSLGLVDVPMD
jgi:hypothetical protein